MKPAEMFVLFAVGLAAYGLLADDDLALLAGLGIGGGYLMVFRQAMAGQEL